MTETRTSRFADLALSRRLERAEAEGNRSFVTARAETSPGVGAAWTEVAGAYALFDGPESPLTQTFGLGIHQPVSAADFEEMEEFFSRRGAPVFHEVSPLADPTALVGLTSRGYRPIEFSSVMFRPISPDISLASRPDRRIRVRLVESGEEDLWSRTAARGWSEYEGLAELILEVGKVNAARPDAFSFLAEADGVPVAAGGLGLHEGVALLAGASTIPEARRQGAQLALLESRLRFSADRGCDIAMMCAQPGSASQRNAERHGFRIAYTRIKWQGPAAQGALQA